MAMAQSSPTSELKGLDPATSSLPAVVHHPLTPPANRSATATLRPTHLSGSTNPAPTATRAGASAARASDGSTAVVCVDVTTPSTTTSPLSVCGLYNPTADTRRVAATASPPPDCRRYLGEDDARALLHPVWSQQLRVLGGLCGQSPGNEQLRVLQGRAHGAPAGPTGLMSL